MSHSIILSIENKYINTYSLKFTNDEIIRICLDYIKITTNKLNYYPTSYDIFDCVKNTIILQTNHIYNYVNKVAKYYKCQNIKQTKNICLVTQVFNNINENWFNIQSQIFDYIYVINYTNKNIEIPNVIDIKSENIKYFQFDLLLLCNDLNKIYNKLFVLYDYQIINIHVNNNLSNDTTIIKDYFNNLSFNKYNFKSDYLIKIDHNLYEYNENFYYFSSLRSHIISSNDNIFTKKKYFKTNPIVIINNIIYDKIAQENIHYKLLSQDVDLSVLDDLYSYICYYYTNNVIDLKIKLGDIRNFIDEHYNISLYETSKLKLINKTHSILKYNIYDYQRYDNSVLINFNNNFLDDLILLLYFTNKVKQKKIFINWNHKIKLSEFIIDEYYLIDECIDNIYNYKTYDFINFDTNINSPYVINIITNKLLINFDNYDFIKDMYLSIKWQSNIQNYIDRLNKLDISNMIFTDLNDINFPFFKDFIKIKDELLIFINRDNFNSINISNVDILPIIELFLIKVTFSVVTDRPKKFYKKINKNYINFNSLLKYSKYIYIENCQMKANYLKELFSYDNLLITNYNDIDQLKIFDDSQYIRKVYVIENKNTNFFKINYIKTDSTAKAINKIIKINDNKCILINLIPNYDFKIFHYYKINDSTIYSDISKQIIYFSKNIFNKLNGFNENLDEDEIIVDFIERCKLFNITNLNIENNNYEFKTIWGPENENNHKIKKISKNYYEII